MSLQRLQTLLTWLGFIPFIFFAAMFLFGDWDSLITPGYALVSYAIYAAVILSFMAGTHWGMALTAQLEDARATLLWSNVIAVMAWIGIAMQFKVYGFLLVCSGFLLQLWRDRQFFQAGHIDSAYYRLRLTMTCCVVLTIIPVILRLAEVI